MSALGLASLGTHCPNRALGMASLGVICPAEVVEPQVLIDFGGGAAPIPFRRAATAHVLPIQPQRVEVDRRIAAYAGAAAPGCPGDTVVVGGHHVSVVGHSVAAVSPSTVACEEGGVTPSAGAACEIGGLATAVGTGGVAPFGGGAVAILVQDYPVIVDAVRTVRPHGVLNPSEEELVALIQSVRRRRKPLH